MKNVLKKIIVAVMVLSLLCTNQMPVHATNKDEIVVVLDAGHDAVHAGTSAGGPGFAEAELNLKIALFCKAKLETYKGVKIYMIRETTACPFPGTNSTQCNQGRVEFSASVGADYYVSFHLNSFSDPSVNGALVFHPNSNYRPDIATEAKKLAQSILNELVALGLKNGGVRAVTTTHEQYRFPDGSDGDTYRVIREGKKAGYPAVIVEHAFVSSDYDKEHFLSSDEKLKSLGEADAIGIAKFLGLEAGGSNAGGGNQSGGNQSGGSGSNSGNNNSGNKVPTVTLPVTNNRTHTTVTPFLRKEKWRAPRIHHNLRYYIEYIHTQKPVRE